ncbi:MAG: hypothetical protein HY554_06070, partial [Elusimicrobia bacterium]|nr:hypothetical protein [Elusimicrobiota bacterium]
AAVQAASAPGAGASARGSAAALAASSWKRRRSPLPVPPRGASKPVDAYGTPRMIALTLGGYAAGFAAMLNLGSWTLPIALAFVPIGAAFAAQRALARGERGRPVVMAAIKGAALGLLTGPPLAGAWLGAKASDLIDRCLNRR